MSESTTMTRILPSRRTRKRMRRKAIARTRRQAAVGDGKVNKAGGSGQR